MKSLNCEVCGGTELVKVGDYFVCQHCGMKYTTENIQKMYSNLQDNSVDDLNKQKEKEWLQENVDLCKKYQVLDQKLMNLYNQQNSSGRIVFILFAAIIGMIFVSSIVNNISKYVLIHYYHDMSWSSCFFLGLSIYIVLLFLASYIYSFINKDDQSAIYKERESIAKQLEKNGLIPSRYWNRGYELQNSIDTGHDTLKSAIEFMLLDDSNNKLRNINNSTRYWR